MVCNDSRARGGAQWNIPRGINSGGIFLRERMRWEMVCAVCIAGQSASPGRRGRRGGKSGPRRLTAVLLLLHRQLAARSDQVKVERKRAESFAGSPRDQVDLRALASSSWEWPAVSDRGSASASAGPGAASADWQRRAGRAAGTRTSGWHAKTWWWRDTQRGDWGEGWGVYRISGDIVCSQLHE